MIQPPIAIESLWSLSNAQFLPTCKKVFQWQVQHNPVYQKWVQLMKHEEHLTNEVIGQGVADVRPIREQIRKLVEDLIPTLFN